MDTHGPAFHKSFNVDNNIPHMLTFFLQITQSLEIERIIVRGQQANVYSFNTTNRKKQIIF